VPAQTADVIRTPDQRLRVFVSSTLAELAEERKAVARAIEALRLTPVMFELGARPHPPQELYRAYLAQSDIFIGLYWQRYGWVGPGMDISGLEDEFRLSGSLPRLIYLKTPAPDLEPRLAEMIAQLQADGTISYRAFETPRELGRLVRDDLATMLSERFAATATGPAPPPAAARAEPSIPVTSTALMGREGAIAAVTHLLESPAGRLVTLTGPGGIGKTRLSIAVAEAWHERAPSTHVVFVPLASVTEPQFVLPRVAAAVGAVVEGTRTPLDVLVEHFAVQPFLLVLDNLEQVVAVGPELDQLLTACPALKILATSRTVLRLRAEREYPVENLAVPPGSPSITEASRLPAVQLFVDRAQAVRYQFELTADNVAAVVEICRRLDGLPLAIELAAARTRLLDPAALLARLEHVLDALGTGPVDLPERQRSLRATIEWSVSLLDEEERRFLAILAVFVDGWTVRAAATVAERTEDQALDLLDALAGQSLVGAFVSDAGPRFRMLTTVREFAAELLDTGESGDGTRRRHAELFRSLVEDVHWPTQRQLDWVDQVRIEEENIRAAVQWYFVNEVTALPHLFRVLWLFWQMGDRMPDGRQWIDQLGRRADELATAEQAELLFSAAVTALEVGDDDSALAALEQIRQRDEPIEDPTLGSALQLAVSWTLPILDDFEGALDAATAALGGLRRTNDPLGSFALFTVGMLETVLGHDDDARAHLSEVDKLGAQVGNNWLESTARTALAVLSVRSGSLAEAGTLLVDSVRAIRESQPITLTVSFALVAHAHLLLANGDSRGAAMALGAAEGLRTQAGLRVWPLARRTERTLAAATAQQLEPDVYREAFEAGAELHMHDALALVG
jgi:predicted ATPase